jgi:hypothetical protein
MSNPAPATPPSGPPTNAGPDVVGGLRLTLGRDLVALGFLIVFASLALAMVFFRTAADVTSVVAPIVTMVGTLVGTVFGVQVAAQSSAAQATGSTGGGTGTGTTGESPPSDGAAGLGGTTSGNSSSRGNPRLEDF